MTAETFELQLERRQIEMRQTAGLIATMIGNCAPFRGENAKTFSPMDFFPDHKAEEERQTADDHAFILSKILKRPPEK